MEKSVKVSWNWKSYCKYMLERNDDAFLRGKATQLEKNANFRQMIIDMIG